MLQAPLESADNDDPDDAPLPNPIRVLGMNPRDLQAELAKFWNAHPKQVELPRSTRIAGAIAVLVSLTTGAAVSWLILSTMVSRTTSTVVVGVVYGILALGTVQMELSRRKRAGS